MKISSFVTLTTIGLFTLSACKTVEDPSQAGFLDASINLHRGTYEKRIEERQKRLDALRQAKSDALGEQTELKTTITSRERKITGLRGEVAKLDAEAAGLSVRIELLEESSVVAREKTDELRRKLRLVREKLDRFGSVSARDERGARLRRIEKEKLEKEIGKLEEEVELLLELEDRG
uniref:Lipoprotein n=1 Tax=Candidatus Kentrum sp. UNK TaxID=2126344 RepID=A0A451AIU0_9GAMM|nr:MAG: hypothetical protein BECKUNK1418G_GA0071005_10746 [Candidatus Kentron sp. UNK]VFK70601.1 MAG: hypothetical protein BECKUNK1418H_GA0071006_103318 [Candidatus Kentron sp. UNK]